MKLLAQLAMYDWPGLATANDRLWAAIRDRLRAGGIEAPERLDRETGLMEAWLSPDLLLAQTCGLPFRTALKGRVTLLGAFDHGLSDAPPGYYYSHLVARADDHRSLPRLARRLAFSRADSQSGWAAAWTHLSAQGIAPAPVRETGAHRQSALAVAEGAADLAAIDAVTWRILAEAEPALAARLRIVETTAPAPGLPLITAKGRDPLPIRAAIALGLRDLDAATRDRLGIRAFVDIPEADYLALPDPPAPRTVA